MSVINRTTLDNASGDRLFYLSRDDGAVFSWWSRVDAQNNESLIYLRNDEPEKSLYINRIRFMADQDVDIILRKVTGEPVGGDAAQILSLNPQIGSSFEFTALSGDITGLAELAALPSRRLAKDVEQKIELYGAFILCPGDSLNVIADGQGGQSTALIDTSIIAWFE